MAVENSCEDIADLLLKAGSNVKQVCAGKSLVLMSVSNGDIPLTEILLEHGASIRDTTMKSHISTRISYTTTRMGHTALHLAVQSKSNDMVQFCLNHKVPINQRLCTGETALMLAAQQNMHSICELLLNNGARMNDSNQKDTPLWLSIYFGCEQSSRILIMHGADVNIAGKR